MSSSWIQFALSAAFIVIAGIRLTRYADSLSEKSQIGKAWIGIVLLGVITSLPEAVASLVSIVSLSANDLAIGNILGSNMFNPLMIVLLDIIVRKESITNIIQPNESHKYAVWFSILMTVGVILELVGGRFFTLPAFGNISIATLAIVVLYFVGIRSLSGKGDNLSSALPENLPEVGETYLKIWINIITSAVVVVVAAVFLTNACDVIAVETGLGQTFVGSILLAIVTSLPEMVVVVSALKMGSVDLAVGNVFGSNMVNIFILAICGLFSQSGPIFSNASVSHILTAFLGIILTYLALAGIQYKNKKTFLGLGIDSIIMILIFTLGISILYVIR